MRCRHSFSGVLVIVAVFGGNLGWFPSIYDTTHARHRLGQLHVYPGEPDDHARDGAGAADHRAAQPLYARLDAGQPEPGLRAHRPRQGAGRKGRRAGARLAQLD